MADMNSYLEFYDLERDPFELTPDPDQAYVTRSYREALAILLYAIKSRKGFAVFYGEKGIGKTTLIRQVESSVDANTKVLILSEGNIPYHSLLKKILRKVKLPLKRRSKGSMLHELYLYLIRSLAEGLNLVLIFDDAHELQAGVLEDLRLLSNLETSRSKLIQIIFVAEPGLDDVLAADAMRQLRQRISIAHRIAPMTRDESMGYVARRLHPSGRGAYSLFTQEALSLIATYSAGIPGRIDRLCHNSLVEGYIRNERPVTGIVVNAVRSEAAFQTVEMRAAPMKQISRSSRRVLVERMTPLVARYRHALLAFPASVLLLLLVAQFPGVDLSRREVPGQTRYTEQSVTVDADKWKAWHQYNSDGMSGDAILAGGRAGALREPAGGTRHYSRPDFGSAKIVAVPRNATLTSLAVMHYGYSSPMLLDLILEMNPEITDIDRIFLGQTIRLPEINDATAILAVSGNSFKIQIGTFTRQVDTRDLQQALHLKNENIEIMSRQVSPSRWWYRVLVGPYPSREACLEVLKKMKEKTKFTRVEVRG